MHRLERLNESDEVTGANSHVTTGSALDPWVIKVAEGVEAVWVHRWSLS